MSWYFKTQYTLVVFSVHPLSLLWSERLTQFKATEQVCKVWNSITFLTSYLFSLNRNLPSALTTGCHYAEKINIRSAAMEYSFKRTVNKSLFVLQQSYQKLSHSQVACNLLRGLLKHSSPGFAITWITVAQPPYCFCCRYLWNVTGEP